MLVTQFVEREEGGGKKEAGTGEHLNKFNNTNK